MPKRGWFRSSRAMFLIGALAVTGACQSSPPASSASALPPYTPTATVKDLMLSVIDPAADVVWLSVTSVQSSAGIVDTAPRNDEDWKNVRHGAITLIEAANLLMIPGRHVAGPGEKSEVPGVELEPVEMEELINKDRPAWEKHAMQLHEAGVAVLSAIEAKDSQKVFEIGEQIELACENCHKQYWYPNEQIPAFPSGQ